MAKTKVRYRLIIEGIIALFIATSPILFYLYKYYPNEPETITLLFIDIESNGFPDATYHLYYLVSKLVPLVLLIIWFTTSKQWWYHVILIPIALYAFQFLTVIYNNESDKIDENEILYVLGVSMIITPIVYFIRLKLVDKYVHGIDLKAMDDELKILREKEALREERAKLEKRKEELAKKM